MELKVKRKFLRSIIITLAVIITAGLSLFIALPRLLIAPAKTEQVDVILHNAIDARSQTDDYVAELYRLGYAGKIVCISHQASWETYPADYARQHLIYMGIPEQNISVLHLPIPDCLAGNFRLIADYVNSQGWKKALLISYPQQSRYEGWLAGKIFEKQKIGLTVTYPPDDEDELTTNWWREHWKVQRMITAAIIIPLDRFYSECR
ncbi:MAG: hypothetical protein L0220_25120 [Acidobacteria bacterium]|nr:hypothetical protein [Acidobacteriota bacterium]